MPASEAQRRATSKYNKENYEYCTVKVKKGKKLIIQSHTQGTSESVNSFINRAIDETIERDKNKTSE